MMQQAWNVAVEGNIGVGKSTLLPDLAAALGQDWQVLSERVDDGVSLSSRDFHGRQLSSGRSIVDLVCDLARGLAGHVLYGNILHLGVDWLCSHLSQEGAIVLGLRSADASCNGMAI